MMLKKAIFAVTLLLLFTKAHAQEASEKPIDTLSLAYSKRATLFSAILPGAGQFYNKKYWKPPIIYLGFATLGYTYSFNQKNYQKFKTALVNRYDNDPSTNDDFGNITDEQLREAKDYYKRNRDLSIILGCVWYSLNIIDAYVDAQLRTFEVSDQLSFKPKPSIIPCGNGMALGLGLSLNFKQ